MNMKRSIIKSYLGRNNNKKQSTENTNEFMQKLTALRLNTAESVSDFKYLKSRVRVLNKVEEVKEKCNGILYWMQRDARVQDNWAFLFSQKLALKLKLPLMVVVCLPPPLLSATIRHYKFLLDGWQQVEAECLQLDIPFHLLQGEPQKVVSEFVCEKNIGAVVCDFSPLRESRAAVDKLYAMLPIDVPFTQVDAHNIVPLWVTSDKQEYAARTIRNKINSKLTTYLTEFPLLIKHKYAKKEHKCEKIDWQEILKQQLHLDKSIQPVDWAEGGYEAACKQLESFINKRLQFYNEKRNDPTQQMLSNLSPWFRYGHISVQRCILEVRREKKYKESTDAFCEEAIIRRELSDNFCYYNEFYDSIKGASDWAQKTLKEHVKDKRSYIYTLEEFEKAQTHDDLWNSAQLQLEQDGKMHGFLRMYWAKKILEWSPTPEKALEYAIYFNDKYALDGSDPNGFVGCMWSICGIHDQGWAERSVFGKIRYMNYEGCKRKFDVDAFVVRYGGKVHLKKK